MQIIFDEKLVPDLRSKYVVLELDTVMQPKMEKPITLYALIDGMNINILMNLPSLYDQHQILVDAYKASNWDTAEFNANAMKGSWHGELDEFYDLVIETAKMHRESKTIWNGIRYTQPSEE